MANITATEVRNAGGWTTTDITDAVLATDPFIPAADSWTELIIGNTLSSITDTDKQQAMKTVNILLCVYLVMLRPPKDGFDVGPIRHKAVLASKDKDAKQAVLDAVKRLCSKAGYCFNTRYNVYDVSVEDDTNTDFKKTYFTKRHYL